MKALILFLTVFSASTMYCQPNAGMPSVPGKCYAKCLIQDQYSIEYDTIIHYKNWDDLEIELVNEMISPSSQKWVKKKANKGCISADPNDCLVWCLVEVEARYKEKIIIKNPEKAIIDSIQVIESERIVDGGFTEWREVVCNHDIDEALVHDLQYALYSEGYEMGEYYHDTLNSTVKSALSQFQKDNGLPIGELDYATLEALGIDLPN